MTIEQIFPIVCGGRNSEGEEFLDKGVDVKVRIYLQEGSSTISSQVTCIHNVGVHGTRCDASGVEGIKCPYSFDIPYILDHR